VVFRILDCRVQSSRTRQGLPPYPCQSGGTVEYTAFAAGVDPALTVTCVSCPPEITQSRLRLCLALLPARIAPRAFAKLPHAPLLPRASR
jgi:hypothetical protein